MHHCSKRLVTYKEYCCFDHSDFPAHSMFTVDVCWGSLGTNIFPNSSSAESNTRSRLPSRLSFRFSHDYDIYIYHHFQYNHFTNQSGTHTRTLKNKTMILWTTEKTGISNFVKIKTGMYNIHSVLSKLLENCLWVSLSISILISKPSKVRVSDKLAKQ